MGIRPHYYPWSIHDTTLVMLDIFNDFSIKDYTRDDLGNRIEKPNTQQLVKIDIGSKQRVLLNIQNYFNTGDSGTSTIGTQDNPKPNRASLVLPMMTLDILDINPATDRNRGLSNKQQLGRIFSDTVPQSVVTEIEKTGTYTPSGDFLGYARQYTPVPWNITYVLSVWTDDVNDSMQILEQLMPLFNPTVTIKIKERGYALPRDIRVSLDSVSQIRDVEVDRTTRRVINYDITFITQFFMYKPLEELTSGIIQEVDIDVLRRYTHQNGAIEDQTVTVVTSSVSGDSQDNMLVDCKIINQTPN